MTATTDVKTIKLRRTVAGDPSTLEVAQQVGLKIAVYLAPAYLNKRSFKQLKQTMFMS